MFRFRLQRVLELREQREQAQAKALAEAEQLATVARNQHERLRDLHNASLAKFASAHTSDATVGHLHHLGFLLSALDLRLGQAAEAVTDADGVVAGERASLDEAARDRRILDRLKGKHEDAHRADEAQRDRVLMDEVALGRYTRARSQSTDGANEG